MKIYLISLIQDKQRRELLKQKFPLHWNQFTWIEAIDAKKEENILITKKYNSNCLENLKKPLTPGEKCCALSHLQCLEKLLQSDDFSCIIIEDDIDGCDTDFLEAIQITKTLPSTPSVAILGGQQGMKNAKHLSGHLLEKNFWSIPKESMPFLTRACCYSINREAAQKIITSQHHCLRRSDIWEYYSTLSIDFFYSNIFRHPLDLKNSHLEAARSSKKFLKNLLSDGLQKTSRRLFLKTILFTKVLLKKATRVEIR